MGHVSQRWRRVWGIRPGGLLRPLTLIGRRRRAGEPQSGPHGRGAAERDSRLRRERER